MSHLVFAFEAKYISASLYRKFEKEGEEIEKMLNAYITYLKKSKQGASEPGATPTVSEDPEPYFTNLLQDSNSIEDTVL